MVEKYRLLCGMLSGKELILATKAFAKEIRWKSWYHTISTLLLLIGAVIGTFVIPNIWGKLACSLFCAVLLSRFFIIFHDFQHHTILNKSKLANVLFAPTIITTVTMPSYSVPASALTRS